MPLENPAATRHDWFLKTKKNLEAYHQGLDLVLNMASREEVWKLCSQGAQALVPGRIVGLAHLEITQDLSQGGESGSEHLLDHQKTSGWGVRHSRRVTHHLQWLVLVQRLILVQWLVIRGTD